MPSTPRTLQSPCCQVVGLAECRVQAFLLFHDLPDQSIFRRHSAWLFLWRAVLLDSFEPTQVRARVLFVFSTLFSLLPAVASAFDRAMRNNFPSREFPLRGQARGSSPRRCRESIGRE